MIESDFFRTQQGRDYFSNQIKQIRDCVVLTCNHEVMWTVLTSHNCKSQPLLCRFETASSESRFADPCAYLFSAFVDDFSYDLGKNLLPHRNVIAAMQKEICNFAVVQKDGRGIDMAVTKAVAAMRRYKVAPNTLIMPSEMQLYVTMVPEERTYYNIAGPAGPATFEAGPEAMRNGTFKGLSIFTADSFDNGDDSEPTQLLRRSTQVGEFYRMRAPNSWNMSQGCPTDYMDILVYDEKVDRLERIIFAEALKYALVKRNTETKGEPGWGAFEGCDGTDGAYRDAYGGVGMPTGTKDPLSLGKGFVSTGSNWQKMLASMASTDVMEARFKIVNPLKEDGSPWTNFEAFKKHVKEETFGTDKFDYSWNCFQLVNTCVRMGIWLPIQIVIARPFIEHVMYSAVIAVAGADTGVTLYGHADMQISANTSVKTIEGHYTAHFKSVVIKPENIFVMRDIMSVQYTAGSDTRFFGMRNINGTLTEETVTAQEIKVQVRNRLMFNQEFADAYESMFAFLTPYNSNEQYMQDNAFSLVGGSGLPWDIGTGQQLASNGSGADNRLDCNFPGGLNMFLKYNKLLGIGGIHTGEDQNQRQSQEFIRLGAYNNSVCLLGPHRVLSPHNGEGSFELVPGQGHWGPDAVPGDARWRRGESVSMKDARDALMGVDVITNKKYT